MGKDLSAYTNKMKQLFITERKKYIIQNEDGSYTWLEKIFNDEMLTLHLERKRTYGIFCGAELTKFIAFDVDIPSKEVVHSIYQILNQIGISTEFIHTSWSGTKGYHVYVYFLEAIGYSNMVKLFDYVSFKVLQKHIDLDKDKIECRPSPTQGMKLPLSINRKNKNDKSNICWFVDILNDFVPIETLDYILNIKPIGTDEIRSIIKNLPTIKSTSTSKDGIGIKKDMRKSTSEKNGETLNSLESLYRNGLRQKGTRNKSLIKLAIWLNTRNQSKESCKEILGEWMKEQDEEYYDTPLKVCFAEINRIVEGVYLKNIVLGTSKSKIEVTRNDLLTIHQYPKKFHKTINALFIHSKRYEDENGEFYMSYEQIAKAAPCSLRTAINHIKSLEEMEVINVTRSPVIFDGDTPYNLPNTYKLKLSSVEDDKDASIIVDAPFLEEYNHTKTLLTLKIFPNKEWMCMNDILTKALQKKTKTNK